MISLARTFAHEFPEKLRFGVLLAMLTTIFIVLQPRIAPAQTQGAAAPSDEALSEELAEAEFDPFRESILAVLAQRNEGGGQDRHLPVLAEYYSDPSNPALWVDGSAASQKAVTMVEILRTANLDVLDPDDYNAGTLGNLLNAELVPDLANLEVGLSTALLDYTRHLAAGRIEPAKINAELAIFPEVPDPMKVLTGVRDANDIVAYATLGFEPKTAQYARLRSALAVFRQLAAVGGWPMVPEGETLKEGMLDPVRVPVLRKRLEVAGFLAPGAHSGDTFNGALMEALKVFQERHGLEIDGAVGPNTLAELNVTVDERVRQIELNMERRRWMQDKPGDFYVFVNLADQFLKVVELQGDREKTIHTALTVVGKKYHRTPVFSEMMKYIVINPSWNVPFSIATQEYLPKLKKDPGVLDKQNIRLLSDGRDVNPYAINWASITPKTFRWQLQQRPGNNNALGQIKFMFPNRFNVYIHDTPSKGLFSQASRVFSHGCVRVQNPFDLADVLLGRQGMSKSQIDAIKAKGVERIVRLKEPIPVHINYLTAWVNKDGTVHFRRDVYGRDETLDKALQAARQRAS
ncbi:murein L,D-transpeptidase [Tepidamorphus sp. 3E244]|uniref:L,D-transpeptidase family protein n=1 Tax=Tepidamorphus sp. 3E244 TaxID=3385498 RepID=UPI0038FC446C